MKYVIPPITKLYLTPTKYPPKKIQMTIFMRYRRQSVPKQCTKLTLSALQYTILCAVHTSVGNLHFAVRSTHHSVQYTLKWSVHTAVCSTHSSDQYTLQCAVHTTVCNTHPLHPLVSSCSSGAQRLPIGNQAVHRQLLITPCETSYNVLCKHSYYRTEYSTQAATNHSLWDVVQCTL